MWIIQHLMRRFAKQAQLGRIPLMIELLADLLFQIGYSITH